MSQPQGARPSEEISAALTTFRASARWKAPDARSLAAGIENPGCNTRRVLDAAGVDKLQLARRLGPTPPEEQSRFATNRGQRR